MYTVCTDAFLSVSRGRIKGSSSQLRHCNLLTSTISTKMIHHEDKVESYLRYLILVKLPLSLLALQRIIHKGLAFGYDVVPKTTCKILKQRSTYNISLVPSTVSHMMAQDPARLLAQADKAYSSIGSGSFFGFFKLFGSNTEKYENAAELYVKAAVAYRVQNKGLDSGRAYEKVHLLLSFLFLLLLFSTSSASKRYPTLNFAPRQLLSKAPSTNVMTW